MNFCVDKIVVKQLAYIFSFQLTHNFLVGNLPLEVPLSCVCVLWDENPA